MRTLLWVVLILDQLFLLVVGSANLNRYDKTDSQLKKHLEGASTEKTRTFRRLHKNLAYVRAQQNLELLIAVVVGSALFTHLITPPLVGLLWMFASLLAIVVLKRLSIVKTYAYQLFEYSINLIVTVATNLKPLWWVTGLPARSRLLFPESQEDLAAVISKTSTLSQDERARLIKVLEADEKKAADILTPLKRVKHVRPNEVLGPVLLADLERSKHGYFPVIDKKEGVVGMLSIRQLGDGSTAKQHNKVADVMSQELVWVADDMPVYEVAKMFLNAKQYVLLVQDESFEFAGIITIADLLKHTLSVEYSD
jgi:CBS domain containing-hemolysin-like protein